MSIETALPIDVFDGVPKRVVQLNVPVRPLFRKLGLQDQGLAGTELKDAPPVGLLADAAAEFFEMSKFNFVDGAPIAQTVYMVEPLPAVLHGVGHQFIHPAVDFLPGEPRLQAGCTDPLYGQPGVALG